jgi:hypothetical protein
MAWDSGSAPGQAAADGCDGRTMGGARPVPGGAVADVGGPTRRRAPVSARAAGPGYSLNQSVR